MPRTLLGIFDSGVGGLSVVQEVRKQTRADITYFGDCLNAPYGNRSEGEIVGFIRALLLALKKQGATHYVSACNSMSVLTTSFLLQECGIDESRYIDMIRAFRKHAVFPGDAVVFVAATHATVRSGEYERALLGKVKAIHTYAFSSLAKSIEDGESEETLYAAIKESLIQALRVGATHFVYGCTHYPLVRGLFEKAAEEVGWNGEFVDPALCVAQEVANWNLCGSSAISFQSSQETEAFKNYSRASIES